MARFIFRMKVQVLGVVKEFIHIETIKNKGSYSSAMIEAEEKTYKRLDKGYGVRVKVESADVYYKNKK